MGVASSSMHSSNEIVIGESLNVRTLEQRTPSLLSLTPSGVYKYTNVLSKFNNKSSYAHVFTLIKNPHPNTSYVGVKDDPKYPRINIDKGFLIYGKNSSNKIMRFYVDNVKSESNLNLHIKPAPPIKRTK